MNSKIWSIPALAALLVACSSEPAGSGGTGVGTYSGASVSYCPAYCSKVSTCDRASDEQTCLETCRNASAAIETKLRPELVKAASECFGAKDCKTVLTAEIVASCVNEAGARLAPTVTAQNLCDEWALARTKCNRSGASKAECLDTAKLYTESTLSLARGCTTKGCADVDKCIAATLGSVPGEAATDTPAPPTSSGGGTNTSSCRLTTGTSGGWTGACATCLEASCCKEANAYISNPGPNAQALTACMSGKCSGKCTAAGG